MDHIKSTDPNWSVSDNQHSGDVQNVDQVKPEMEDEKKPLSDHIVDAPHPESQEMGKEQVFQETGISEEEYNNQKVEDRIDHDLSITDDLVNLQLCEDQPNKSGEESTKQFEEGIYQEQQLEEKEHHVLQETEAAKEEESKPEIVQNDSFAEVKHDKEPPTAQMSDLEIKNDQQPTPVKEIANEEDVSPAVVENETNNVPELNAIVDVLSETNVEATQPIVDISDIMFAGQSVDVQQLIEPEKVQEIQDEKQNKAEETGHSEEFKPMEIQDKQVNVQEEKVHTEEVKQEEVHTEEMKQEENHIEDEKKDEVMEEEMKQEDNKENVKEDRIEEIGVTALVGVLDEEPVCIKSSSFNESAVLAVEQDIEMISSPPNQLPVNSPTSARTEITPPGDMLHHIKNIQFNDKKVGIVTQNENGPCPLVAILNVLLLRRQITLPAHSEIVSAAKLMEYIGDAMLKSVPKNLSGEVRLNYEQNMDDAMAVLPKLQTGLDVNVKFTGVRDFEYTPECIIFDLLRIPLFHGWLVDPQTPEVVSAVGQAGYNQLVEKVISQKCSNNEDAVMEALVIENFLERSASQLTYHGLSELTISMEDDEIGVLFRNNHFSTIYKHQKELLQLVTDQGFLGEPNVVWETLGSIDGDGQFVDSHFRTVPPKPELVVASSSSPNTSAQLTAEQQIDHDFLVALSLQEEQQHEQPTALPEEVIGDVGEDVAKSLAEDEKTTQELLDLELARQLQQEEERQAAEAETAEREAGSASPQQQQQQQQASGSRSSPQSAASKKKDNCILL